MPNLIFSSFSMTFFFLLKTSKVLTKLRRQFFSDHKTFLQLVNIVFQQYFASLASAVVRANALDPVSLALLIGRYVPRGLCQWVKKCKRSLRRIKISSDKLCIALVFSVFAFRCTKVL